MVLSATLFDQFFQEMVHPSLTKSPTIFALVYAPGFVNHSVLFSLKVYRFMTSDRFQRRSSLLTGFLKEYALWLCSYSHQILTTCILRGLIMYACATGEPSSSFLALTPVML